MRNTPPGSGENSNVLQLADRIKSKIETPADSSGNVANVQQSARVRIATVSNIQKNPAKMRRTWITPQPADNAVPEGELATTPPVSAEKISSIRGGKITTVTVAKLKDQDVFNEMVGAEEVRKVAELMDLSKPPVAPGIVITKLLDRCEMEDFRFPENEAEKAVIFLETARLLISIWPTRYDRVLNDQRVESLIAILRQGNVGFAKIKEILELWHKVPVTNTRGTDLFYPEQKKQRPKTKKGR